MSNRQRPRQPTYLSAANIYQQDNSEIDGNHVVSPYSFERSRRHLQDQHSGDQGSWLRDNGSHTGGYGTVIATQQIHPAGHGAFTLGGEVPATTMQSSDRALPFNTQVNFGFGSQFTHQSAHPQYGPCQMAGSPNTNFYNPTNFDTISNMMFYPQQQSDSTIQGMDLCDPYNPNDVDQQNPVFSSSDTVNWSAEVPWAPAHQNPALSDSHAMDTPWAALPLVHWGQGRSDTLDLSFPQAADSTSTDAPSLPRGDLSSHNLPAGDEDSLHIVQTGSLECHLSTNPTTTSATITSQDSRRTESAPRFHNKPNPLPCESCCNAYHGYDRITNMRRHFREQHGKRPQNKCRSCGRVFTRQSNLKRHQESCRNRNTHLAK